MMVSLFCFSSLFILGGPAIFARAALTARLDNSTVSGVSYGTVNKFLGIPYALPPIGDRRFRLPVPISYSSGSNFSAYAFGPSCPQQAISLPVVQGITKQAADMMANSIFQVLLPDSEDCLTVNVIAPATATPSSKLPVVVWIHGGGWEVGSSKMYDGTPVVQRSILSATPIIYVSMNYRLTGFGFLASKEVKAAGVGNLGLQDQREALRWVQKYISAFGGDPTKVTLWGESAGAISSSLHMLVDGGNTGGLFRAAFLQSGSPMPVGDITNGQVHYDALVQQTGCKSAADTLDCLRKAPYATLKAAIDKSPSIFAYQSLNLAWMPRADGVLIADAPQKLVQQGKVANIPLVTGDCDDEGTMFSFSTLNLTTDAQVMNYIQTIFFPSLNATEASAIRTLYPDNLYDGSPYDTGVLNALSPQYKRIASFFGDVVFQAPRRLLLQHTSSRQNTWVFLSKRYKTLASMGSFHSTDLLNVYYNGDMVDYLIRFVTTLNPNGNPLLTFQWPKYTTQSPWMLTFWDGVIPLSLTEDNYRAEAMNALINISLAHPI